MDYITYNIIFTEIMTNNIEITENAQIHIADLLKNDDSKFFRITVQGGGCAGFQYKFEFDNSKKEHDIIIETSKVNVLISVNFFIRFSCKSAKELQINKQYKSNIFRGKIYRII